MNVRHQLSKTNSSLKKYIITFLNNEWASLGHLTRNSEPNDSDPSTNILKTLPPFNKNPPGRFHFKTFKIHENLWYAPNYVKVCLTIV